MTARLYAARGPAGTALLDLASGRWKFLDPIAGDVFDRLAAGATAEAAIDELTDRWAATGADPAMVRASLTSVTVDLATLGVDSAVRRAQPASAPVVRFAPGARPSLWARVAGGAGLVGALLFLRVLPFRHVVALARAAGRLPGRPARVEDAESLLVAVRALGAWWPGRIACLEESLAVHLAAALTGRPVRWVLGARFVPRGAHAWVVVDGHVIGQDEADRVWPYLPVLTAE
ncbi:lasso peptide biosynthesis B2 protein [Streptomyces sp. NPDC046685]|uniref:lasso peptide biosynthesis B2 protein n=1 Tax=Streptomyces sp. NPDC046685 TaxID=3157202 RepID=UPI0033D92096